MRKNKRYIVLYDPLDSINWEYCVDLYKSRATDSHDGLIEVRCTRWQPEDKLENILDALYTANPESLKNVQLYLHCQDIIISTTALSMIREMVSRFGVIATNEFGVIE